MSDENFCEGDLRLLAEFDCPAEELRAMSVSDKRDLIKTIRLSLSQSVNPVHENSATPTLGEFQNRLQNMGVSMTRVGAASRNDDGDQDIMILKEITSPGSSSMARPPVRSPLARPPVRSPSARPPIRSPPARPPIHSSPARPSIQSPLAGRLIQSPSTANSVNKATPMNTFTPIASTSGTGGTRKKIDKSKPTKGQVVSPIQPESNMQCETTLSQDFRNPGFRAEMYALNPLTCTNTELSTLAETSSLPIRKRTSVPFFYTEHALSLKTDDYVELCCRKFGCKVPSTSDEVEEATEVPKDVNVCNASDEPLDFPLIFEESSAKYNLRQRTGTKRTANDFEFNITDDDDSDSIIPSKKSNRNETDTTFTPKVEAKNPKTRANKLSLATTKIAAERTAKASNVLAMVDSDDSNNSDVPGKEVYAPKLEYSAAVANDKGKWKTSKGKVSAQPKGQNTMEETLSAMDEKKAVKQRQPRAKPSDAIKPVPISGKNRRAALTEGVTLRKPGRGKQANKRLEKDDNEENEEQDDLLPCPICKERFPEDEIQTHVNACCDDSATKGQEGLCPVCSKNFPQDELENHCSLCEGNAETPVMDED